MRSGWSVDTPPDGETAMGPSLPTECEASCSAWAVECLLAACFYNSLEERSELFFRNDGNCLTRFVDMILLNSPYPPGYQLYSQARIDLPQQQSRHMT